jgi:transaldolase
LVFKAWVEKLVNAARPALKAELKEQLERLYNAKSPAESLFRGCTTNPPLSWSAVQSDPKYWAEWVAQESAANPGLDKKQMAWRTYKEIVKRGADLFLPIHQASQGRFGWISGQLDPRLFTEVDQMVHDAEELRGLAPRDDQGLRAACRHDVLKIPAWRSAPTPRHASPCPRSWARQTPQERAWSWRRRTRWT